MPIINSRPIDLSQGGGNDGPNVNFTLEEIRDRLPEWELIQDVLDGSDAVKHKGPKYLPMPCPSNISGENRTRYEAYKERAVFYNVTYRTLMGLLGQVFLRDPVLTIPDVMAYMENDVDGGGVTLDQQALYTLGRVCSKGRAGLMVDYPQVEDGKSVSRADTLAGNVRPTVLMVEPEDVINYRRTRMGSKAVLSLVVIRERVITGDDGFETTCEQQWRVLRLYPDGCHVEIWVLDKDKTDKDFKRISDTLLLNSAGKPVTYIPFTFTGPVNNDPSVDRPPLYDMAVLNIAHYRNSADYEEASFIAGQPTPYASGLTQEWVDNVLKGTVELGSRACVCLPAGGQMGLVQAQANSMPKEAMEAKERQMVALGAKLVEQLTVQRTATEASMEQASENSVLSTAAKNVAAAYTQCLQWAADLVDPSINKDEIEYELNTDFDIAKLSAQDQAQLVANWMAGAMGFEELRWNFKRSGIAYMDDEEVKTEAEENIAQNASSLLGAPGQNQDQNMDQNADQNTNQQ